MKENETSEDVTKTPSEKNNPGKTGSSSENTLVKGEDEEKKEGDEFIREGHGHDYSVLSTKGGRWEGPEDQSVSIKIQI